MFWERWFPILAVVLVTLGLVLIFKFGWRRCLGVYLAVCGLVPLVTSIATGLREGPLPLKYWLIMLPLSLVVLAVLGGVGRWLFLSAQKVEESIIETEGVLVSAQPMNFGDVELTIRFADRQGQWQQGKVMYAFGVHPRRCAEGDRVRVAYRVREKKGVETVRLLRCCGFLDEPAAALQENEKEQKL